MSQKIVELQNQVKTFFRKKCKKVNYKVKKAFSDVEFYIFKTLLKRYCSKELDQWSMFKVDTPYGKVFISIVRSQPQDNSPETAYDQL